MPTTAMATTGSGTAHHVRSGAIAVATAQGRDDGHQPDDRIVLERAMGAECRGTGHERPDREQRDASPPGEGEAEAHPGPRSHPG